MPVGCEVLGLFFVGLRFQQEIRRLAVSRVSVQKGTRWRTDLTVGPLWHRYHVGSTSPPPPPHLALRVAHVEELRKHGTPDINPQIVGFPYNEDSNKP